jgi:hypothetical protein
MLATRGRRNARGEPEPDGSSQARASTTTSGIGPTAAGAIDLSSTTTEAHNGRDERTLRADWEDIT